VFILFNFPHLSGPKAANPVTRCGATNFEFQLHNLPSKFFVVLPLNADGKHRLVYRNLRSFFVYFSHKSILGVCNL
jgi:hypothetical protein